MHICIHIEYAQDIEFRYTAVAKQPITYETIYIILFPSSITWNAGSNMQILYAYYYIYARY